jgi:ribosomal protein S18 acetylase RimI-like enzyme
MFRVTDLKSNFTVPVMLSSYDQTTKILHPHKKENMLQIHEVTQNALERDLSQIARVHMMVWQSTYVGIVPQDYLDALNYNTRLERWQKQSGNIGTTRQIFAATLEGKIVGFADCGAAHSKDMQDYGELYSIYILKEAQGMGIGKALLEVIKAALVARGFKTMLVWVLLDNLAVQFYKHLGGLEIKRKNIEIGGKALLEIGFEFALE